jgi:LPXTG-site transpeptidase (sortase) family protein
MKKPFLMFISAFCFALLFFYGVFSAISIFAPALPEILSSFHPLGNDALAQLPLSADRLVPFATPDPNIIVNPYPIQAPIVPPYTVAQSRENWIRIPSLNINVPLVLSPTMKDADVIKTLATGAALYPNGVTPGALGNAFISAHSTGEPWKGTYRFAFLKINELKKGDMLYVDYKGARYAYRMTGSEIVNPTPEFRVISDRPVPTLSLMACWPLWSTKQRMLIHAQLTNITQLTRPQAA